MIGELSFKNIVINNSFNAYLYYNRYIQIKTDVNSNAVRYKKMDKYSSGFVW